MAARRMMLPDYGTVSMKGTQYYRTRVTDQQGRHFGGKISPISLTDFRPKSG